MKFTQPAEWELHDAVWLAWPSHADLWQEDLLKAQEEFVGFCSAIADVDPKTGSARGETLEILVPDEKSKTAAEKALKNLPRNFHVIPFGDIWLRDTGPIFVFSEDGKLSAARFDFNGWGEKYLLPYDDQISKRIANAAGLSQEHFPF